MATIRDVYELEIDEGATRSLDRIRSAVDRVTGELRQLNTTAGQLTAEWDAVIGVTDKLTAYYGRLKQAADAYIASDAQLAAQTERTAKAAEQAETAFGGLLVEITGFREGAATAEREVSLLGDSLSALTTTMKAMEKESTGGKVAVFGLKTALSSLLLGPLAGVTTAFRLYNALLGETQRESKRTAAATLDLGAAMKAIAPLEAARTRQMERETSAAQEQQNALLDLQQQALAGEEGAQRILELTAQGYELSFARRVQAAEEGQAAEVDYQGQLQRLSREVGPQYLQTLGLMDAAAGGLSDRLKTVRDEAANLAQSLSAGLGPRGGAALTAGAGLESGALAGQAETVREGLQTQFDYIAADFERKKALLEEELAIRERVGAQIVAVAQAEAQASARITQAFTAATTASVGLGVDIAALGVTTLAAGGSFEQFGAKALEMFGNFAAQAGKVILLTGLGELALFSGNPIAAIAAGTGLVALGSVIGGIAQRTLGGGGESGGGAGSAPALARSLSDTFRRDQDDRTDDSPTTVVVYFGTERLEGAVTRAVRSAQRNGRLPSPARGGGR